MSLRSFRPAWIAWGLIWMAGAGHLAAAEQYKVRLVRPYKVGYEFDTEATITYKREVGGNVTSFTGQLYGTVKGLEVNEKTGGVTQVQCTVARLTRDGKELYQSGVVLVGKGESRRCHHRQRPACPGGSRRPLVTHTAAV